MISAPEPALSNINNSPKSTDIKSGSKALAKVRPNVSTSISSSTVKKTHMVIKPSVSSKTCPSTQMLAPTSTRIYLANFYAKHRFFSLIGKISKGDLKKPPKNNSSASSKERNISKLRLPSSPKAST